MSMYICDFSKKHHMTKLYPLFTCVCILKFILLLTQIYIQVLEEGKNEQVIQKLIISPSLLNASICLEKYFFFHLLRVKQSVISVSDFLDLLPSHTSLERQI